MFYFFIQLRKIYLLIIIYYICYSYSSKHSFNNTSVCLNFFNKHHYKNNSSNNNSITFIVYNLQRLPYLLRDINIDNIINRYNVCILQEYFNDLFFKRNRYLKNTNKFFNSGGKNIISSKLIDSGLVTTSDLFLEFIDFIQFKKYKSVDKYANKGFLISKLNLSSNTHKGFQTHTLFIVNTHLQNFYTTDEYNCSIISKQLKSIDNYLCNHILKKNYTSQDHFISLLVAGDFNRNLKDISWSIPPNQTIYTKTPTVWDNRDGLLPLSTPRQIHTTQYPYWTDGAFLWSDYFKATNISNVMIDKHTDHCGIEFTLQIK
jgi:hypothetical protein